MWYMEKNIILVSLEPRYIVLVDARCEATDRFVIV